MIKCSHILRCMYAKSYKCSSCKNNRLRNKEESFYEEAKDNPIPEKCPHLSYSGPAEQTRGYECPVCGEFTNPYFIDKDDPRCCGCGYKFNLGHW